MKVEEVRLWKLTRRHVRERLEAGQIKGAILPTGSTEQHNEHLAMEHDTASAEYACIQSLGTFYTLNKILQTFHHSGGSLPEEHEQHQELLQFQRWEISSKVSASTHKTSTRGGLSSPGQPVAE